MVHSVPDLLVRDRAVYGVTAKGALVFKNPQKFAAPTIDQLVWDAVFATNDDVRDSARWIVRQAGLEMGAAPASIHELYAARGRKECGGFTVPAINVRGLSYDVARAVLRAARRMKVGTVIFEVSRVEINYTCQRPAEFVAVIVAASIREGFDGPLFIQGDHYRVNPKKYAKAYPDLELQAVRDLCRESIAAGFHNIDIDSSTLVDYSRAEVSEQQRPNFETCAELAAFVRSVEPAGVTVALGGEIGEIGEQNSTVEELDAFMHGFGKALDNLRPGAAGLAKISVNTGAPHGGVVLPDGSRTRVEIDFDVLRQLSAAAHERYKLAGTVQHGASTLPADAFHKFPECGTTEVHLATEFQNMIYEDAAFPADLKQEIYQYLRQVFGAEKKPGESDQQFIIRTRLRGFGPFKQRFWELPPEVRARIGEELERKFAFLFAKLNVGNTMDLVRKKVAVARTSPRLPEALAAALRAVEPRA